MPTLLPEQIAGATFLAARSAALLADEPGYGKTAQAIAAADYELCRAILVVTTASARANWLTEFRTWSDFPRTSAAVYETAGTVPPTDIVVVAWSNVAADAVLPQLLARQWDVLILDESHYAKSPQAQRSKAVWRLAKRAARTWCLSGTPIPNSPLDLWPMLNAIAPETLSGARGYEVFMHRYCVVQKRMLGGVMRDVVKGGRNLDELGDRLRPIMLRRKTVGLPPIRYATWVLRPDALRDHLARMEDKADAEAILAAAEAGDTDGLEMHLGPLRRMTGTLKAYAAADLLAEELENGLDKIVVWFWHTDAGRLLREKLAPFGVVGIDGSTPAAARQEQVERFQRDPAVRVFVGQIQAAGEAITLTAAAQTLFVEPSFVPKDMGQAVRRILRRGQTRPCICRVAALEGSIDEALMRIVTRKVAMIRDILET